MLTIFYKKGQGSSCFLASRLLIRLNATPQSRANFHFVGRKVGTLRLVALTARFLPATLAAPVETVCTLLHASPLLVQSHVTRCNCCVLRAAGLTRKIDVLLLSAALERLATVRAINQIAGRDSPGDEGRRALADGLRALELRSSSSGDAGASP